MKALKLFIAFFFVILSTFSQAQSYFPPNSGTWDTASIQRYNWCEDKVTDLYNLLETQKTKAFIVLIDGKIVLEKYFNNHKMETPWYWASAGKSLTSFMIGLAQEQGFLDINDKTSKYLGKGWTSAPIEKEDKILIKNQLMMTSGLDDKAPNTDCTADSCLVYLADANTRWAYHNAPYTLLDDVITNSTGKTINKFVSDNLNSKIGFSGAFVKVEDNNVFFSTARSMARFGLLIQAKGKWGSQTILADTNYFNQMVNTSQNLNKSYGYLWWLNGKESFMLPGSQFVFPGFLLKNAPADAICALGKNGQFINIVPSMNLVLIRMGDNPDNSLVPVIFNDDIWAKINALKCEGSLQKIDNQRFEFKVFPNPSEGMFQIQSSEELLKIEISNPSGEVVFSEFINQKSKAIDLSHLAKGIYSISASSKAGGLVHSNIAIY